jgi:hypothetical protein
MILTIPTTFAIGGYTIHTMSVLLGIIIALILS